MAAVGTAPEVTDPAPGGGPAPERPPGWRRFAGATVPPLLALVAGWLLLAYRSGSLDRSPFRPSMWSRWDSGQYLRIAREGYTVSWECSPGSVPPSAGPGPHLCGNAGWFPGYPAVDRALAEVAGLSLPVAAVVVSWTCWYLVLLLMWRLLADARSAPSRWLCLGIAACFPGQVYFAAVFPISLTVAGMLACLYAATRPSRPLRSGVLAMAAGAVAGYSYITPVALVPALILTAFLAVRGRRRVQALLAAAGVLAGFTAVLLTMRIAVGLWNAYFLSAEKYGVGANSPLETLGDRLEPLWKDPPRGREFLVVTASQTLLTLGLVVLVTAVTLGRAALARRRVSPAERPAAEQPAGQGTGPAEPAGPGPAAEPAEPTGPTEPTKPVDPTDRADPAEEPARARPSRYARWYPALTARISPRDLAFLLAAGGVWVVPYIAGGQASTYRSEAFVILGVPLLRRLPWWLLVPVLAVVVVTAWRMAPYFFNGKLA